MGTIAHVITQIAQGDIAAPSEIAHVVIQTVQQNTETARIAHVIVQIAQGAATPVVPGLDLSGIYTIEPNKVARHDSYYENIEKKIPDPTIRTALIGE